MRAALFSVVVLLAIGLVAACGDDPAPAGPTLFGSDAGNSNGSTVACNHPGAGAENANGRCECATPLNVAGTWSSKRTCRESDTCPTNDGDETFTITQSGSSLNIKSGSDTFTGTICGDIAEFLGSVECGQLRFTDDKHFFRDTCYVASGACTTSWGRGCPGQKGQCTGTGAKSPETAASISKDICK